IQPGMPASLSVDAFPGRTFEGTVTSILPQAQVVQNATMFPVLVAVSNPGHLLKPGMNAEVRIHTGQRQGVLTVPNAALRTPRDVGTAATMLGLDSVTVAEQIAARSEEHTSELQSQSNLVCRLLLEKKKKKKLKTTIHV